MRHFTSRLSRAAALLSMCVLLSPLPGSAATPAKKDAPASDAKPGGAFLTKDQLRACLARQSALKQADAELEKEQVAIDAVRTELTESGQKRTAELETLDRTKAEVVDAYNAAGEARDRQLDAYGARVDAFNKRVEAGNVEREGYRAACLNRRFFEEDEAAIKKGK